MTDIDIRPFREGDLDAVVALSLRAWAPVFASIQREMDPAVYAALYPGGWEASQAEAVRAACTDEGKRAFVAEREGALVGFVVTQRHQTLGEVHMVAVDPAFQGAGAGAALTAWGIEALRAEGVSVVMVETGGDPGHAPARRLYERAGFRVLPIARYFKAV